MIFSPDFSFDFFNFKNSLLFSEQKVDVVNGFFFFVIHLEMFWMWVSIGVSGGSLRLIDIDVVKGFLFKLMIEKRLFSGIIFFKFSVPDSVSNSDPCFFS